MKLSLTRTFSLVLVASLSAVPACAAAEADLDGTGRVWSPYLEWSLPNELNDGNPFDIRAAVTFTHEESGEQRTTSMFYAGGQTWKFRFTGTRTGKWTFRTSGDQKPLDGHRGTVMIQPNPDREAVGFTVPHGTKFARQTGEDGQLQAFVPNIYMDLRTFGNPERCGWTGVSPTFSDCSRFAEYLDAVEAHGCNAAFALIGNQWFKAGAVSSDEHQSREPDPKTFEILEQAIQQAHERGMLLHIFAWGDAQRRWTPVRVGGINGEADRRVQRYLGARLGPLPGWTMSYGFDLSEWVGPEQVESWAERINRHSGWPRLLSAREVEGFDSPNALPVASNDDRPADNFYTVARRRLEEAPPRPVLFERRFTYKRDGVWDMTTTRRAFWQFTLAGGAASIWGHYPPNCAAYAEGDYPNSEQLRTHRRFWKGRFLLDMEPAEGLTGEEKSFVLRSGNRHAVFYREDAESVAIDLSWLDRAQQAVAVDAARPYKEIDLGRLEPEQQTLKLPRRSDWAVAVGAFAQPSR